MQKLVLTSALMLTLTIPGFAQSLNDGSIYSRFGVGERQQYFSSKAQGMGGGGYALASTLHTNFSNPASLGDLILTRFAGGLRYESLTMSAEGFDQSRLASGALSGVHLSFPIKGSRTGVGLSLAPYTRVSYRIQDTANVTPDPGSTDESAFIRQFNGNGGLYALTGGVGHRITNRLSVGARLEMIFGLVEELQSTQFNDARFVDRTVESSTRLRGAGATLGGRYAVTGFDGGQALVVAGTISLPVNLSGERSIALTTSVGRDTLGTTTKGDVQLPFGFGGGIAYQPTPKWTVIADATFENWSSFESDFDFPGYAVNGQNTLTNRVRVSTGVEYWPAAGRAFASYGQRVAYRAGLYSDRAYLSPDANETIRTIGLTTGLSIPSLIPGTTIDLNLDVGRRGTTANGLIKDRYVRFGLNINFGERWFDRLPLG